MALKKFDKFTCCFADFVRYLNVVEVATLEYGFLDARGGFLSRDDGVLTFWMQDLTINPDKWDKARYSAVFDRVDRFVQDLNRCRTFSDSKIKHTFDLYDKRDGLSWEVFRHDR